MSDRQHFGVQAPIQGVRLLSGGVRPNGATAAMAETNTTDFVVTRTGAGAYKLTTRLGYFRFVAAQLTPCATAVTGILKRTSVPVKNAMGQFEFNFEHHVINAGAFVATDVAANAASWFDITVIVDDTVMP